MMIGQACQDPYSAPYQPAFEPSALGPLRLVTGPAGQAISTDDAKSHCRIYDTIDDVLAANLIRAATDFCQHEISGHRQFLTATFDLPVECWWSGWLKMPRPPLGSVVSIKYFDSAGVEQTLSSSTYLVTTAWRQPGRIERAPLQSWPSSLQDDRTHPITIRFTCGYGAAADIPECLRHAVRVVVAWLYENREPAKTELAAVRALLETEGYGSYA